MIADHHLGMIRENDSLFDKKLGQDEQDKTDHTNLVDPVE